MCRQSRGVTEPAGEKVDASKAVLSLNGRGDPRGRPFSMAGGYKTRPYGENAVRYVRTRFNTRWVQPTLSLRTAAGGVAIRDKRREIVLFV